MNDKFNNTASESSHTETIAEVYTPPTLGDSSSVSDLKNQKPLVRFRDEKGHFVSSPEKICSHNKKTSKEKKQQQDKGEGETVKIRIVKDKQPIPETDYEGRLEDLKERTAINFIKAICIRKPKRINIDGNIYYAECELESLAKRLQGVKSAYNRAVEALKQTNNCMKTAVDTVDASEKCLKTVSRSRSIWRYIAISTIAAFLTFVLGKWIGKGTTTQPSETMSDARVEQAN